MPLRAALNYWQALNAPATHVAQRLGIDVGEVVSTWNDVDSLAPELPGYPSVTPWAQRTVTALVSKGLTREDSSVLVHSAGEGTLTVGDVRALVLALRLALTSAGAGAYAPVAIDASQRLEAYLVVLATMLIGAPVVRLAKPTSSDGLQAMLRIAPSCVTISAHARWLNGMPEAGHVISLDSEDGVDFAGWVSSFPDDVDAPAVAVSPADTALIGFTSGSTGTPKCIHTSHEAVFRSTEVANSVFDFRHNDVFATSTDFSALSAFRSLITLPFLTGGRVLIPSAAARETPLALAIECQDFGVTVLTAVPAVLRGLIAAREKLGPDPLASLRFAFSGSGILDQATRDRFENAFGRPSIDYYGGRECATVVYADPADSATVSSAGGVPVNCLVRLVDDNGCAVAMGKTGEIFVVSDSLMQHLPEAIHAEWQGWYATGDLGRFDHSGRLQVVGRKRDIIKARDGTLLFPIELEAQLSTLDGVAEAAIFGFTSHTGVEHVIAAVISTAQSAEFASRCRTHMLAVGGQHRIPSRVFVMSEMPRVASGKIDRPRLISQLLPQLQDL